MTWGLFEVRSRGVEKRVRGLDVGKKWAAELDPAVWFAPRALALGSTGPWRCELRAAL